MLHRVCAIFVALFLCKGMAREPSPIQTLAGHQGSVLGLAFSPNGERLATSSRDGFVKLWNAKSWALLETFAHHKGAVYAVVYSPAGDILATCGADQTIQLLDPATGKVSKVL